MDERERDKFYSPPPVTPDDDDGEYELEPLDPAVIEAETRHGQEIAEQARTAIDIDEVYREAERSRGSEVVENWVRNFRYRFKFDHVLIATAVLAVAIALGKLDYLIPAVTVLIIGSIAGLYFYLSWQDRKQQAEAEAKRQELYAKRRKQLQSKGMTTADAEPIEAVELTPPAPSPPEKADMWEAAPETEPIYLHFSMRSLMIALTVSAVSLGMIHFIGGPGPTATILGAIAIIGLLVHALGFVPPQSIVLGWWLILLLYVLLTIAGAAL